MRPEEAPAPAPSCGEVVLRAFGSDDVTMLCELSTDPYVPLVTSLPPQAGVQQAVEFIARQHRRLETGVGYSFCLADRATDHALGTAGLWIEGLAEGRATAGYTVAPSARGRGVAREALSALTEFAWTLPELRRVELCVEPSNAASLQVASAAGYVRRALLSEHQLIGDRLADMVLLVRSRPDV